MKWVWQHKNYPDFTFNLLNFSELEKEFLKYSGEIVGVIKHLENQNSESFKIEILTQESLSTSLIEGEILARDSVQSSIRKNLGLKYDNIKIPPNAAGISEMMVDVYLNFDKELDHQTLYNWHKMVLKGSRDIENVGEYRNHDEPMQIVSGNMNSPKVFYEAPPSEKVFTEMDKFINWYNANIKSAASSTIVFAGLAHLYFEIIHPFEDGNGRIGRALVEKAISQQLGSPSLNSFAKVIESRKKEYYEALQSCNYQLNADKWLGFFANCVLDSQKYTIKLVEFLIAKTKFFARFENKLNERQIKVANRIFQEGVDGFKGGLSAANYKAIASTSPATTTRDLQEMVSMQAAIKKGELKHSRYFLNLE